MPPLNIFMLIADGGGGENGAFVGYCNHGAGDLVLLSLHHHHYWCADCKRIKQ